MSGDTSLQVFPKATYIFHLNWSHNTFMQVFPKEHSSNLSMAQSYRFSQNSTLSLVAQTYRFSPSSTQSNGIPCRFSQKSTISQVAHPGQFSKIQHTKAYGITWQVFLKQHTQSCGTTMQVFSKQHTQSCGTTWQASQGSTLNMEAQPGRVAKRYTISLFLKTAQSV